jgi:hypothetical protein
MWSDINNNVKFNTLAQYGDVMMPAKQVAQIRGMGKWNPPPTWETVTKNNAKYNENNYTNMLREHYINDGNNYSLYENNRAANDYYVGSSFHEERPGSWKESTYAPNQYVNWAMRAAKITPNPMLTLYFSTDNVNYIQNRTKQEVAKHTNKKIDNQSVDELMIIMLNNYLYALTGWLPNDGVADNTRGPTTDRGPKKCDIKDRLVRLNKSTIEETVKQVLAGIKAYEQYYKDQSSMPMPLELPVLASMAGSRILSESIGFDSGHDRTIAAQSFNQRYNII